MCWGGITIDYLKVREFESKILHEGQLILPNKITWVKDGDEITVKPGVWETKETLRMSLKEFNSGVVLLGRSLMIVEDYYRNKDFIIA